MGHIQISAQQTTKYRELEIGKVRSNVSPAAIPRPVRRDEDGVFCIHVLNCSEKLRQHLPYALVSSARQIVYEMLFSNRSISSCNFLERPAGMLSTFTYTSMQHETDQPHIELEASSLSYLGLTLSSKYLVSDGQPTLVP